jgi:hypothetical protein
MIQHLRNRRILPHCMNAPRDLRVEDELLSGAAAVANARNAVVIDSGAGPGDGGAGGEPKEGGSLVEVMQ